MYYQSYKSDKINPLPLSISIVFETECEYITTLSLPPTEPKGQMPAAEQSWPGRASP